VPLCADLDDDCQNMRFIVLVRTVLPSQSIRRRICDDENGRLELDAAALDHAYLAEASERSREIQDELWSDVIALTETDRSAITDTYINTLVRWTPEYQMQFGS